MSKIDSGASCSVSREKSSSVQHEPQPATGNRLSGEMQNGPQVESQVGAQNRPPGHKPVDHLAIIPDGNRRWAKERGLATIEGHRVGLLETSPAILKAAFAQGIHTVTLWLFSAENWSRDSKEIDYLMKINKIFLETMLPFVHEKEVRVVHLGRKERIPPALVDQLKAVEKATQEYDDHLLNVAIDYGGRDELLRVMTKLAARGVEPGQITEETICRLLDTAGQEYPCPDVMIRTSGEHRVSGFLPWQSYYSELFFIEKHFPDFTAQDLESILDSYQKRERRFGR